jgi:hypothetical protein
MARNGIRGDRCAAGFHNRTQKRSERSPHLEISHSSSRDRPAMLRKTIRPTKAVSYSGARILPLVPIWCRNSMKDAELS